MGRKVSSSVDGQAEHQEKKSAKFFDKKAYRFKKYSSKYKLDKWENNRRKEVLKSYYKELKNDPLAGKYKPFNFDDDNAKIGSDVESGEDEVDVKNVHVDKSKFCYVLHPDRMPNKEQDEKVVKSVGTSKPHGDYKTNSKGGTDKKMNTYFKVKQEMNRLKEEKTKQREDALKAKAEKQQAMVKYKQNKADKFKKLSKKSRSGQPVMKDRMQMLLDVIQRKSQ